MSEPYAIALKHPASGARAAQPTIAQANTVHLAWDLMVGIATLLFLLSAWYALCWIFKRDMPQSKWFLRVAACAGVLSIIAMEAGWVVTEVGRQPWIVFGHMKVEDAATTNSGVWLTFIVIVLLYIAVAITTIAVLRRMSRRFRETDEPDLVPAPYGPRDRTALDRESEEVSS